MNKKEQIANQLIAKVADFPPLPVFISKILALNSDADSPLDDISRVVEAEVSMATAVIRLANSPFFGLKTKVGSVSHAIAVLGRDELVNLVLASAMFQTCAGFSEKKGFIADLSFHGFKCGVIARYLASQIGQKGGEFFLAGLIHDVGKIIIYLAFSTESFSIIYQERNWGDYALAAERKRKRLGVDHMELGAALLESWLFPASLKCAVKYHHQPQLAKELEIYPAIINIADILVYILAMKESGQVGWLNLFSKIINSHGQKVLSEAGFDITIENIDDLLTKLEDLLVSEGDLTEMFG